MKVALINVINNPLGNIIENLGLASIASFLRENGVQVELKSIERRLLTEEYVENQLASYDLYGFAFYADNAQAIFNLAGMIKEINREAITFVGGRLATDSAQMILDDTLNIDYVILGDGEVPVLEMVKQLRAGQDLASLEFVKTRTDETAKKPYVVDVCKMPYAARDMLKTSIKKGHFTALISSSRGCCGNCSFCSANSYSHKWQGREVEKTYNEIITLYETYGVKSFLVTDNSLEDPGILGKQRIEELCNLLIQYPVKFAFKCYLRAETFSEKDADLIRLMKQAGFSQVFIGLEAANEQDLKLYNKKATPVDNQNTIDLFSAYGMDVIFGFIMFNPLSTAETLKENFLFLKHNKSFNIADYTGRIQLYYNTDLYWKTKEHDLLKADYTYLTPYNYYFKDQWVEELSEFLTNLFASHNISSYDFDLVAYLHIINYVRTIYPEESKIFVTEFKQLTDQIASLLAKFFELVYVHHDFALAETSFQGLLDEILPLYMKIRKLIFKVIKNIEI